MSSCRLGTCNTNNHPLPSLCYCFIDAPICNLGFVKLEKWVNCPGFGTCNKRFLFVVTHFHILISSDCTNMPVEYGGLSGIVLSFCHFVLPLVCAFSRIWRIFGVPPDRGEYLLIWMIIQIVLVQMRI